MGFWKEIFKGIHKFDWYCIISARAQKETYLKIKKLLLDFIIAFAVVLVFSVIVTYLWNLIEHGSGAVDWGISLIFAISVGVALSVSWARRPKQNRARTHTNHLE
jgi:hypothetical protein